MSACRDFKLLSLRISAADLHRFTAGSTICFPPSTDFRARILVFGGMFFLSNDGGSGKDTIETKGRSEGKGTKFDWSRWSGG